MVRRHLAGRLHARRRCARCERLDGLARREVHEVERLALVLGEREVALDHQRLSATEG